MININNLWNNLLILMSVFMLNACSTFDHKQKINQSKLAPSFLNQTDTANTNVEIINAELLSKSNSMTEEEQQQFRFIAPFKLNSIAAEKAEDILSRFSEEKTITMTADELPLKNYLTQVFGELLGVSYVLGDEIKNDKQPITLHLQEALTERKLFLLTEEILAKRDYLIKVNDGVYYIHKSVGKGDKNTVVFGYGNRIVDVPETTLNIIQMVPFTYGLDPSLAHNLKVMLNVTAVADNKRNQLSIRGKRKDILKALQLVRLMDRPTLENRHIGIYRSTFLSTDILISKLTQLLAQEGISLSKGSSASKSLSVVALDTQNELIFFANSPAIIERGVFWAQTIDKPLKTVAKQYFVYQPQYSRAIDMGTSLEALIGDFVASTPTRATSVVSENNLTTQKNTISASSDNVKMVVDERANLLIFHTAGEDYQQLLPLIKRLDVLPKQIILEVMIAEVTLTDEFKQGVEFAFTSGAYGLSTAGAFMGDGFGGLSYLLQGENGSIALNLFQANSNVNVLSRPSIVVRDGVNASISVGTDIPIVGQTVTDPLNGTNQTTTIEYRKTGVELSVTPTVNAQGVILMEIKQSISNQLEVGATVAGSPSVFERSINTEVVADSGQSIVLGGLISESRSSRQTKVPVLGDLPFIGKLFQAETESGDKTELVVFVTPRLIESSSEWDDIILQFTDTLNELVPD
jgi:general secretion pathway protein D